MKRAMAGAMLALAGLLAVPAVAADHTFSAGPVPNTYAGDSVTIDQGDTLTFQNNDQALHDITADGKDSDGKALFKSETIGAGKSSPVEGVEFLTTGDYPFHCSVHPFMQATLHVTANGTPKQRPSAPPPDTTPPSASVAIKDSRIRTVLKRKALRLALSSNEESRFKLTAKVGRTVIARGTATVTDNTRNASIRLTKAGRKLLARSRRVTVKLGAAVNDAAGNTASASATRKLKR
jgi:plastocyanin